MTLEQQLKHYITKLIQPAKGRSVALRIYRGNR